MDEFRKTPKYSELAGSAAKQTPKYSAQAAAIPQKTPKYSELAGSAAQQTPKYSAQAEAAAIQHRYSAFAEQPGGTATYIDDNGNAQTGTVVPTEEQQAQAAAESQQAQQNAAATEAQAQETQSNISYLDQMRQEYEKMYNAALEANNAAAAANIEQVLSQIDQSKKTLTESYKATNRQLYRDYMEVLRTTPQKLAQMGYSGGMSESSRIGVDTNYQEALAENERARLASEAELDAQGAQSRYSANATAAEANANAYQQYQTNLINLLAQEQTDKQQRAEVLASIGDFSGYGDLGYTQAEIDAMTLMWLRENPSYRSTWIQSHPEEAARLGIRASSRRRGGGSGGGNGENGESGGGYDYSSIFDAESNRGQNGAPWSEHVGQPIGNTAPTFAEIEAAINDAYANIR